MELLWPALIGITACLLALWYGETRARVLRRRCAHLQSALETQRDTEMRLDFIAHHDCLTGLPNRLQFQLRLEHGVAYARRHKSLLAVLFVDIDHFKRINDTLGHDAGDQVLVQFSQRLRQCVRVSPYQSANRQAVMPINAGHRSSMGSLFFWYSDEEGIIMETARQQCAFGGALDGRQT